MGPSPTLGPAAAIRAVVLRPWLWSTAIAQVFRLAAPGWWHTRPFLPVPPRGYMLFRLETASGTTAIDRISAAEVVGYLEWCRAWPHFGRW